jgi:hypothetical protein
VARRSKDNRILVRIGEDSRKRLARNAAASDRAIRRAAKKAATRLRRSQREIVKRATQLARRLARERARDARREAKRREKEQRRRDDRDNGDRPKRKRPFHPKGPYATEEYTSYARRLERSKSLRPNQIDETHWSVNGWVVTGNKSGVATSCNCPDFTQIDLKKNWIGSSAGPFNPCKHMLAIKGKKYTLQNIRINCSGCAPLDFGIIEFFAVNLRTTNQGQFFCPNCPSIRYFDGATPLFIDPNSGLAGDFHPSAILTKIN